MTSTIYEWLNSTNRFLKENSDHRSKDWVFMDSPIHLIMACSFYLYIVCRAGPKHMENKKPYDLRGIITAYNLFQIVACITIIKGMLSTFPITQFGCEAINNSDPVNSYKIARWTYWVALFKVTEFAETIFFVLRKKQNQISYLHLYHHVSTLSFGWITTKFYPGEATVIPIVLNSFIHVLMYAYYLVALYGGREIQKKIIKWKKSLTILQMFQFTVLIAHTLSNFRSHCSAPKPLLSLFLINIIINYILFYKFYKSTYKQKIKNCP